MCIRFHIIFLASVVTLVGCKKGEDPEPYVSFASQIIGTWTVQAFVDNDDQSIEGYPNDYSAMTITFTTDSKLDAQGPCSPGLTGTYLVSENGGLTVTNFEFENNQCNILKLYWEQGAENALNNAYHISLNGSQMTIFSNGVNSVRLRK